MNHVARAGGARALPGVALFAALSLSVANVAAAPVHRPVVALTPSGEIAGGALDGLERPADLAIDHRGDVVIADAGNHRVLVVSPVGRSVRDFGGYGWEDGRFDEPTDVAVYPGFYVYVLDRGNRRVQRFDADGDYLDTPLVEGEAGSPTGIEVGAAGELLVVDEDSQIVRVLTQFDEPGEPIGHFGPEGGGLVAPSAVAVGPSREIAVADAGRYAVEVFDEFGTHLRSLTAPDTVLPSALVFDRYGNLAVADAGRGRVLLYAPGRALPSASIGRGVLGTAFEPVGLAVARDGRLLVLDAGGPRLLWVRFEYGGDDTRR